MRKIDGSRYTSDLCQKMELYNLNNKILQEFIKETSKVLIQDLRVNYSKDEMILFLGSVNQDILGIAVEELEEMEVEEILNKLSEQMKMEEGSLVDALSSYKISGGRGKIFRAQELLLAVIKEVCHQARIAHNKDITAKIKEKLEGLEKSQQFIIYYANFFLEGKEITGKEITGTTKIASTDLNTPLDFGVETWLDTLSNFGTGRERRSDSLIEATQIMQVIQGVGDAIKRASISSRRTVHKVPEFTVMERLKKDEFPGGTEKYKSAVKDEIKFSQSSIEGGEAERFEKTLKEVNKRIEDGVRFEFKFKDAAEVTRADVKTAQKISIKASEKYAEYYLLAEQAKEPKDAAKIKLYTQKADRALSIKQAAEAEVERLAEDIIQSKMRRAVLLGVNSDLFEEVAKIYSRAENDEGKEVVQEEVLKVEESFKLAKEREEAVEAVIKKSSKIEDTQEYSSSTVLKDKQIGIIKTKLSTDEKLKKEAEALFHKLWPKSNEQKRNAQIFMNYFEALSSEEDILKRYINAVNEGVSGNESQESSDSRGESTFSVIADNLKDVVADKSSEIEAYNAIILQAGQSAFQELVAAAEAKVKEERLSLESEKLKNKSIAMRLGCAELKKACSDFSAAGNNEEVAQVAEAKITQEIRNLIDIGVDARWIMELSYFKILTINSEKLELKDVPSEITKEKMPDELELEVVPSEITKEKMPEELKLEVVPQKIDRQPDPVLESAELPPKIEKEERPVEPVLKVISSEIEKIEATPTFYDWLSSRFSKGSRKEYQSKRDVYRSKIKELQEINIVDIISLNKSWQPLFKETNWIYRVTRKPSFYKNLKKVNENIDEINSAKKEEVEENKVLQEIHKAAVAEVEEHNRKADFRLQEIAEAEKRNEVLQKKYDEEVARVEEHNRKADFRLQEIAAAEKKNEEKKKKHEAEVARVKEKRKDAGARLFEIAKAEISNEEKKKKHEAEVARVQAQHKAADFRLQEITAVKKINAEREAEREKGLKLLSDGLDLTRKAYKAINEYEQADSKEDKLGTILEVSAKLMEYNERKKQYKGIVLLPGLFRKESDPNEMISAVLFKRENKEVVFATLEKLKQEFFEKQEAFIKDESDKISYDHMDAFYTFEIAKNLIFGLLRHHETEEFSLPDGYGYVKQYLYDKSKESSFIDAIAERKKLEEFVSTASKYDVSEDGNLTTFHNERNDKLEIHLVSSGEGKKFTLEYTNANETKQSVKSAVLVNFYGNTVESMYIFDLVGAACDRIDADAPAATAKSTVEAEPAATAAVTDTPAAAAQPTGAGEPTDEAPAAQPSAEPSAADEPADEAAADEAPSAAEAATDAPAADAPEPSAAEAQDLEQESPASPASPARVTATSQEMAVKVKGVGEKQTVESLSKEPGVFNLERGNKPVRISVDSAEVNQFVEDFTSTIYPNEEQDSRTIVEIKKAISDKMDRVFEENKDFFHNIIGGNHTGSKVERFKEELKLFMKTKTVHTNRVKVKARLKDNLKGMMGEINNKISSAYPEPRKPSPH